MKSVWQEFGRFDFLGKKMEWLNMLHTHVVMCV